MQWLSIAMAAVVCAGIGQAVFGALAVRRFSRRVSQPLRLGHDRPAVTVLKPLHGDEPLLENALASLLMQVYDRFQVVVGVQNPGDPALAVVARLRARFPGADIAVVVDSTEHGANRKVSNLINMMPLAKHEVLVIADSDVHVAPDYLDRIVAELAVPGTGLVTTVYTGLPATMSLPAALGATTITHGFLPGALMSRALGRQDCLGATMALRRETLAGIGGLRALADHIADDHILGKLVLAKGLTIRMAATITATTVPETAMPDLFQHELRWARTILALVPREYAMSLVQYPLFWAGLAIGCSGGEDWAVALFLCAWLARACCARRVDRCIAATHPGFTSTVPVWLLREVMSMFVAIASYGSDNVEWRGRVMHTGPAPAEPAAVVSSTADYQPELEPAAFTPPNFVPPGYAAPTGYAASNYAPHGPSAAS
jgi:ceramide glucosyltransferase